MEKPVKGDLVVLPFPFSDLTLSKRRPALVLANPQGDNLILCQITSKAKTDHHAIVLSNKDFKEGGLHLESRVRPNKLFTADRSIISYICGTLKDHKTREATEKLVSLLRA